MDVADKANAYAEQDLACALQNRHQFHGTSATHCIDCDDAIPDRRRESLPGVQRCVECQFIFEERTRK